MPVMTSFCSGKLQTIESCNEWRQEEIMELISMPRNAVAGLRELCTVQGAGAPRAQAPESPLHPASVYKSSLSLSAKPHAVYP